MASRLRARIPARDRVGNRAGVAEPPPAPPGAENQVWVFKEHPGYRRAMESAGTVAAPLLAGFSFALLGLLVPTFGATTTTVTSGDARLTTTTHPFSALPEVAAVLFLLAGLLLIASVQAAISARYHGHSPTDLETWYPEYFPDAELGSDEPPEAAKALDGWDRQGWPALRAGHRWYAGWIRQYFYEETWRASRWAGATRLLYHLGIFALLSGLTALVAPPGDSAEFWRWVLLGAAVIGALAELVWIAFESDRCRALLASVHSRAKGN